MKEKKLIELIAQTSFEDKKKYGYSYEKAEWKDLDYSRKLPFIVDAKRIIRIMKSLKRKLKGGTT